MIQAFHKIQNKIDHNYLRFKFRGQNESLSKVSIEIDSNRYILKTIDSLDELRTALRLRYKVFIQETLKKCRPIQMDVDHFDTIADHLIVIHKETNQVVGTYRLISSFFSNEFYSQTEFELSDFLKQKERMLELGRACIHPEHRSGLTLALLWKGIRQYMEAAKIQIMFGCTSLNTTNPDKAYALSSYLRASKNNYRRFKISPLPSFQIPELSQKLNSEIEEVDAKILEEGESLVPTLLKSYLKAGSRVVLEPAYDEAFQCFDFFTILDIRELDQKYSSYFKR